MSDQGANHETETASQSSRRATTGGSEVSLSNRLSDSVADTIKNEFQEETAAQRQQDREAREDSDDPLPHRRPARDQNQSSVQQPTSPASPAQCGTLLDDMRFPTTLRSRRSTDTERIMQDIMDSTLPLRLVQSDSGMLDGFLRRGQANDPLPQLNRGDDTNVWGVHRDGQTNDASDMTGLMRPDSPTDRAWPRRPADSSSRPVTAAKGHSETSETAASVEEPKESRR